MLLRHMCSPYLLCQRSGWLLVTLSNESSVLCADARKLQLFEAAKLRDVPHFKTVSGRFVNKRLGYMFHMPHML